MAVAPITTHVTDAIARLYTQYAAQPNLVALLRILFGRMQVVESMLQALEPGRALATAQGAQLDRLGEMIGLSRNGLDDGTYRTLLRGVIGQNYADGTMPTLLQTVQNLFLAAEVYRKDAQTQGSGGLGSSSRAVVAFELGSPALPLYQYDAVQKVLLQAMPAGVALMYLAKYDASGAFSMDGPQSSNKGFGDINDASQGGGMAELFANYVSA